MSRSDRQRLCNGRSSPYLGWAGAQVISFSLTYHGVVLFEDTTLELNNGHRYGARRARLLPVPLFVLPPFDPSHRSAAGLIGRNGTGKSTLLTAVGGFSVLSACREPG